MNHVEQMLVTHHELNDEEIKEKPNELVVQEKDATFADKPDIRAIKKDLSADAGIPFILPEGVTVIEFGPDEIFADIEEDYLNAKRLGPYWNTRRYKKVVEFEEALVKFLRGFVDSGLMTQGELYEFLHDRGRTIGLIMKPGQGDVPGSPLSKLRQFIYKCTNWYNYSYGGADKKPPLYGRHIVQSYGDGILARVRVMIRQGRRLWVDLPYWKNTEWVGEEEENGHWS